MIAIHTRVFNEGWDTQEEPRYNACFLRAVLDAFSEGYYFYDSTGEVSPDEPYQEAIEAGIAETTRVLVED